MAAVPRSRPAGRMPWRQGRLSRLLLAGFLLLAGRSEAMAAVEAAVSRQVVGEGESVQLRIEVRGDSGDAEPDLTPLERDFEVTGTRRSSQVSIVNGRVERSRTWLVTLVPRRRGELTIPAVRVGGEVTRPLTLTVRDAPAGAPGSADDVFLEVEAEPLSPYVQARVRYTVRIFYRELSEGDLAAPHVDGAVVRRLGEDRAYTARRDSRRYRVLERTYALFPERSGTLTVPPPVFTGRVPDGTGTPGSPFGRFGGAFDQLFQGSRTIRRQGEAMTLEVRPRPAAFQGEHWLPAAALELSETWSGADGGTVRVGEPLTRTVVLEATGLEAAQLPAIAPPQGPAYRAYADQPVLETGTVDGDLVARREESHAIIPTAPGELRLPAVTLRWWSTVDDGPREATLPGRTVQVLPAAGNAAPPPAPDPAPPGAAPAAPATEPATAPAAGPAAAGWWPFVAAGLLAAWLVTLALLVRARRGGRDPDGAGGTAPSPAPRPGPALAALERASTARDPAAARDALLAWGRARWPDDPPFGLPQLGQRAGGELAKAVAALDRALYGGGPAEVPAAVWRRLPGLVKGHREAAAGGKDGVPLPHLYPGTRETGSRDGGAPQSRSSAV